MKGFVLDKSSDEDTHVYNVSNMQRKLYKDKGFDNVNIINPEESNRIYIINNIYVQSNNEKVKVALGEENNNYLGGISELFICEDIGEEEKLMHINTVDKLIQDNIDILQGKYIILLPKGYVNIKVDNPVKEMNIEICWKEEKIY